MEVERSGWILDMFCRKNAFNLYGCVNKLLQTQWLMATQIYYLIVSIGQESSHGLPGLSASGYHQTSGKESTELHSSLET